MTTTGKERGDVDEIRSLFASACDEVQDRESLLVAAYEICSRYRQIFANAVPQTPTEWETWKGVYKSLQAAFAQVRPVTAADARSVPTAVRTYLKDVVSAAPAGRPYHAPLVIHATLETLDQILGKSGSRRTDRRPVPVPPPHPPRLIESFLYRGTIRYWVLPRAADWGPPWATADWGAAPADHNLASERWLRDMTIIPDMAGGTQIVPGYLAPAVARHLTPGPHLRVGVWPISRHLRPEFHRHPDRSLEYHGQPHSVYFVSEPDPPYGEAFSRSILPLCAQQDVSVLVLPELSVGPQLRHAMQEALRERDRERVRGGRDRPPPRPVLVVAGSFHELHPVDEDTFYNRSIVLDYRGRVASLHLAAQDGRRDTVLEWSHHKLARFRVTRAEAMHMGLAQTLGLADDGPQGAVEPTKVGESLGVVFSPIGRMCVGICIDFLDPFHRWHDPLQRSWADWFFVPAASPELGRFKDPADRWAFDGTASVIANACWVMEMSRAWAAKNVALAKVPGVLKTRLTTHGQEQTTQGQEHPGCALECEHGCLWVVEARAPKCHRDL